MNTPSNQTPLPTTYYYFYKVYTGWGNLTVAYAETINPVAAEVITAIQNKLSSTGAYDNILVVNGYQGQFFGDFTVGNQKAFLDHVALSPNAGNPPVLNDSVTV